MVSPDLEKLIKALSTHLVAKDYVSAGVAIIDTTDEMLNWLFENFCLPSFGGGFDNLPSKDYAALSAELSCINDDTFLMHFVRQELYERARKKATQS